LSTNLYFHTALKQEEKEKMVQDLIHGTAVSFKAEGRVDGGEYGTFIAAGGMLYPGLSTGFNVDVEEVYEEVSYTPAHGEEHNLELIRNVKVAEELPFNLVTFPQVTADWPLLKFITGSASGLGDQPDSTSWLKELVGEASDQFSLFTGVMLTDYKCEIPGLGAAKETISGFAGNRASLTSSSPSASEAQENTSHALTWKDIYEIKMDAEANPTESIIHCISDISFGFTSEIAKQVHPESTLSTKMCGVRVVSRKMFVSLKLTWVDQSFLDVVTGSGKKNLKLIIGPSGHRTTFVFGGLYFPKYVAKADPKELVGDTITCIVDQPIFSYSTA
jgi:hypothetical protein